MPNEAQAVLVTLDEDPEQMLSLTAMGEDGRPAYRAAVVSLLPTETIASTLSTGQLIYFFYPSFFFLFA